MAKPSKPKPSPAAAPAGVPLTGVKADKRRLNDQRVIVKALVLLHVVDDKRVGLQNGMGAK